MVSRLGFVTILLLAAPFAAAAFPVARPALPDARESLVRPVVLHGTPVPADDDLRPAVVAIEVELDGETRACSGFLISPRHVVSVAQCFFPRGRGGEPAGPERVRVRWSDPSIADAVLRPERVLIHPGYARTPTVDAGWFRTLTRVSPFDLALLSFPAGFSGGARPFPVDAEDMTIPAGDRVRVYGMRGGALTRGEMLVERQRPDEKVALLKIDEASAQSLETADMGGPALALREDGARVVWGLLAGQDTDFRGRPAEARVIQLQNHVYWLMNQMQPELNAWLNDAFAPRVQAAECRPKAKAVPAKPKKIRVIPLPAPRPRNPGSVAAAAAGALRPAPETNPLLHRVIVMGKEAAADSPLLKSVVNLRTGKSNCSGTLISPIHVLTAAHCFDEAGVKDPSRVRARFYRNSRDVVLEIPAVRVRPHHIYRGYPTNEDGTLQTGDTLYFRSSFTDIALITLERPVPAPHEPMAMLPFEIALKVGDQIHVAGTGRDSLTDKESSAKLKSTTMNVAEIGSTRSWKVTPDGNGGAMPGDSGGAALFFDKTGRPYLWGVIIQTAVDEEASKLYHSRVLPVFNQSGWIYENIQADLFDILGGRLRPHVESVRTIRDCP